MDTCNCYHPAFLSHTTSYEKWELCQLEVTDEKEDQEMYECVMEIMNRLTLSILETLFWSVSTLNRHLVYSVTLCHRH